MRFLSSLFAFNRLSSSIGHSTFCLFAIHLDESAERCRRFHHAKPRG